MVRNELRVKDDIHQALQAASPTCLNSRDACNRIAHQPATAHESQSTRTLGYEQCPIRQKRDRPRLFQLRRECDQPDMALLGRFKFDSFMWQRRCRPGNRRRSFGLVDLVGREGLLKLRDCSSRHREGHSNDSARTDDFIQCQLRPNEEQRLFPPQ